MIIKPEIEELYDQFVAPVYAADTLDKKTKEIIATACSLMADCEPCIRHHYAAAVAAGATREELAEAFTIGMAISAGSKRAKYKAIVCELAND